MLSESQLRDFERDGFLVARGVIDSVFNERWLKYRDAPVCA